MVDAAMLGGFPDRIVCRWCNRSMNRTVLIPPLPRSEGVAIYRCEQCSRVETRFIKPEQGRGTPNLPRRLFL